MYFIEIEIENVGFGGFYQDAEIWLAFVDDKGESTSWILESEMKGWKSGERRTLECTIEAGNGKLFLMGRRKRDGAVIRFGHAADGEGKVMLGNLMIL